MSSTRKPVIVRQFSREWSAGYASASPPEIPSGTHPATNSLELLDPSGKLLEIPWEQIKWICYLREPLQSRGTDTLNPERLLRRKFSGRPRMKGLWLRMILGDGDELEGVAANDRSLLDPVGLMLIPPDTRSNTQRVFVPRSAIRELTVLGVLGVTPARIEGLMQPELFPEDTPQ